MIFIKALFVILVCIAISMSYVFAQMQEIPLEPVQQISIAYGSSIPTNTRFFDPELLSIPIGSVVNWTNNDVSFHTVTFLDTVFDSGIIPPGNSTSHQFSNQGIFNYHCKIHPFMIGELRIS